MDFVFIEDRDAETGHGWRDLPHRFILSPFGEGPDRNVVFQILDEDGDCRKYDIRYLCSYAWIFHKDYWEQHHHVEDNIRTYHITAHIPSFCGACTMESHFEFKMNPIEMREYLLKIGMTEVKRK